MRIVCFIVLAVLLGIYSMNIVSSQDYECPPGICDPNAHKYCSDDGKWTEQDYCEKCGRDGICASSSNEGFFSGKITIILVILVLIILILIAIVLFFRKHNKKAKVKHEELMQEGFEVSKKDENYNKKYYDALRPFVENAFDKGYNKEQVRSMLADKSWPGEIIESILSEFYG